MKVWLAFAGKPAVQDRASLVARLTGVEGRRVEEKIVQRMVEYFAPQLPYASDEHLRRLYDLVKASPLTSTKSFLKTNASLVFIGMYSSGMPSRYETRIVICQSPPLIKVAAICRLVELSDVSNHFSNPVWDCRAMLMMGFRGTKPVLCKFTLDSDVAHEYKVLQVLWAGPSVTGIVGPVEKITFGPGGRVAGPQGKSSDPSAL